METACAFPTLETDRLILRTLRADDAPFVLQHFSDPDVCRYLYDAEPLSKLDEALQLIGRFDNAEGSDHPRWALAIKDTGGVIGTCGFLFWERDNHIAEIGYDLARPFWSRGYMLEAVSAVLRHGFEAMQLNRVQATVALENRRSARLLERLGFQREGILRERFLFRCRYYDHYCFSLLRREWTGTNPA